MQNWTGEGQYTGKENDVKVAEPKAKAQGMHLQMKKMLQSNQAK